MAEEIDNLIDGEKKEQMVPASRISELSNKVKSTAQERDEKDRLLKESESKTAVAEKKAGFYKDFSKLSSKYPGAGDHLDEIEAKVMAGYDPEDATVSVLAKAGKLTSPKAETKTETSTIAGGSATTTAVREGAKSIDEMTRDEKRQALIDIENETGGVSRILERRSLG
jgi:hypothetical protein